MVLAHLGSAHHLVLERDRVAVRGLRAEGRVLARLDAVRAGAELTSAAGTDLDLWVAVWETGLETPVGAGEWGMSAALAFSHGANDAQKSIGVIAALLLADGRIDTLSSPLWATLACAAALTLGTGLGGWRIIRTVGRGIYRIHQFSKVEMFGFCANEAQAQAFFDEMVDIQVGMYTELGLHFELRDMATEDLGAPAYRKFDVLAWMPGRHEYGEVSSLSMCTDFQARRLNIRHKDLHDKRAKAAFVHTLNGTACAVPRLLISLWETYQQADGSIVIPDVLRPYMGGQEIIRSPA